jgi:hypothetical protein
MRPQHVLRLLLASLLAVLVVPAAALVQASSGKYNAESAWNEDFCKTSGPATEKGYGYLRVYDYARLAAPTQIGEYRTPNSRGTDS